MNGLHERRLTWQALLPPDVIVPRPRSRPREGDGAGRPAVRVASVSGGTSYGRGGDPDAWRPAAVGLPISTGDRLYTARGACLELRTVGLEIRLGASTGLEAVDLGEEGRQFYLWGGAVSFLVGRLRSGEFFGVETPTAMVTIESAGEYQVDVERDGRTRLAVPRGSARLSAAGVSAPLGPVGLEAG